jgi:CDP-diacylglycerol--glycerol-3-phosphate 3-phosphatidyltransferase
MKITANQVTLARLILLPIPCALLFGETWHQFVALILFIGIGLTDYLDGYLARKQGPTTLGALLDPMADKIFVTAMFIPLAHMEVVPIWMVLLLFIREYTVTELRSIHGSGGLQFRTSELAKYKTTIQMIGGGAIIGIEIFGPHRGVFVGLGVLMLFGIILAVRTYLKNGRLGPRIITFLVLVAWGSGMRCVFSYQVVELAIMALIVGVTCISGFQYVTQTWRHLGGYLRERFGSREWASFVGISLAFPIIYVSTLYSKEVATWMIIAILSLEFAVGGLKNLVTTLKASSTYDPQLTKTILLNGAGLVGLLLILLSVPERTLILNAILLVVLLASLIYCLMSFYTHRHAIFAKEKTPA